MNDPFALVKVRATTAVEIVQQAKPTPEALALLDPHMTPRQYLEALARAERYADALKFLAFALPRREAVWWGCVVVRLFGGEKLSEEEQKSLLAAAHWVIDPNEHTRQEAEAFTAKDRPGGCLAQAVAWTGGSMTPAPLPPVVPPPALAPMTVYGALMLTTLTAPPEKMQETFRTILGVGLRVARGLYHWPATPPQPAQGVYRHH